MSFINYISKLNNALKAISNNDINIVYDLLLNCKKKHKTLFFCGNGGSAGNANHLANDFIYGVAKKTGEGFKVHSLAANASVLTCLANDVGYSNIYSEQIEVLGSKDDVLVCLSGSGNSENILRALDSAKNKNMKTISILGYDGGKAKLLSDHVVHIDIDDMQIAEDFQLILFHYLMQKLYMEYNNV